MGGCGSNKRKRARRERVCYGVCGEVKGTGQKALGQKAESGAPLTKKPELHIKSLENKGRPRKRRETERRKARHHQSDYISSMPCHPVGIVQ